MEKRILVTFGRTDPLHLTEATYRLLGGKADYVWGPDFGREKPEWAWVCERVPSILDLYDVIYTGHGATLLEATAAGCEVMCLHDLSEFHLYEEASPKFISAWTGIHLDHSGRRVAWWEPGVMASMSRELRDRRVKV